MEFNLEKSDPRRLAELIGLDEVAMSRWRPEELSEVLQHQLRSPLMFHENSDNGLPCPEKPVAADTVAVERPLIRNFDELFLSHQPPLMLLRLTKDFAKASDARKGGGLPAEVAMILYYATIVAALVRCHERITDLNNAEIRAGVYWALSQPWTPKTLIALFESGLGALSESARPSEDSRDPAV